MYGTTLILVFVNKKPWCSAWFINTELIVKLLIKGGVWKVQNCTYEKASINIEAK
jgi:hypothetical protein